MGGRIEMEEFDQLLDTLLPTVVRDSAASGSGRLYRSVMVRVETPLLRLALELSAGNQLKAARLLGINRNTLRKRISGISATSCPPCTPPGARDWWPLAGRGTMLARGCPPPPGAADEGNRYQSWAALMQRALGLDVVRSSRM